MTARGTNLSIHEEDRIAWVTIDRPQDRNSLDSETIAELKQHLDDAEARGVRVIVYRGVGETYFIGGADGVEMYRYASDAARRFSRTIQALFDRMEQSPLVLVAAINGLCFGGGLEFALACDFRVAAMRARLGLPEVRLGIIPGGGGTQRLPRVVGFGKAVEMVLRGRLVSAREALDCSLVHKVVKDDDLMDDVRELSNQLISIPAFAQSAAKSAIYASQMKPMDEGLRFEAEQFATCFSQTYFADTVREQLSDGRLETTRETTVGEEDDVHV